MTKHPVTFPVAEGLGIFVGIIAWDLLTESGDTDAVFTALLAEYAVDAAILHRDLDELWQGLLEAGLVAPASDI